MELQICCSINGAHPGPFALYLWKATGYTSFRSNKAVWNEHRSMLCQECAKRVGAYKLSAKTVEKERTNE